MRVALKLAYNGAHYFGSQQQKETTNTILGKLLEALKALGIDSKVVASGRTDRGVHATGQVCHLDLPEFWSNLERLLQVLNNKLPSSIRVLKIQRVKADFHARYSTKKRVYRYLIKEGETNPFESEFITFLTKVNFTKLAHNIKLFEGRYDFKHFMKSGSDVGSTEREIFKAFAYKHKEYIILYFEANGFLRSQIRMMVASLLHLDAQSIKQKLGGLQDYRVKPAPPNGLYLAKIKY